MELGALVCIPRAPLCLACPVAADCRSRSLGIQDRIPLATPKAPPKEVAEACAIVSRDRKLLIVKRGPERLWEHFWEFPTIHLLGPDPAIRSHGKPVELAEGVRILTGVEASIEPVAKTLKFGVTTHRVTLETHRATWIAGEARPGPGLVDVAWEPLENLGSYTFSSASRRLIAWLETLA